MMHEPALVLLYTCIRQKTKKTKKKNRVTPPHPGLSTHPASMCARASKRANERGLDSPNLFVTTTFTQNRGMIVCSKLVVGRDNLQCKAMQSKARQRHGRTLLVSPSNSLGDRVSTFTLPPPCKMDEWIVGWMDDMLKIYFLPLIWLKTSAFPVFSLPNFNQFSLNFSLLSSSNFFLIIKILYSTI
jgi:hypothetical protein